MTGDNCGSDPVTCARCPDTGPTVRVRHIPGTTGPGWSMLLCDVCVALPPPGLPDTAIRVLTRRPPRHL